MPKYSPIPSLQLDSGASDCFVSPEFLARTQIPSCSLPIPITLRLFDGTLRVKSITNFVELTLSSADGVPRVSTQFLVTPLDTACDAILGLNWLTETNPKINWATHSVMWTPIADYKTALLRAILTSEPLEDLPVMEDDEDNHPDPLKFVPPEYTRYRSPSMPR
jgi:hypothetical protein